MSPAAALREGGKPPGLEVQNILKVRCDLIAYLRRKPSGPSVRSPIANDFTVACVDPASRAAECNIYTHTDKLTLAVERVFYIKAFAI